MASYHMACQIIGRSPLRKGPKGKPRSVVAMAAYRAGERLVDARTGQVADYSKRRGVVHAEIMAPQGSATWLTDRVALWNGVEAIERRKDAQLAREMNLALPHELPPEARLKLVRTFVTEQFIARGMVADVAIHEPVAERGDDPRNIHAHVLLTLRQATAEGLREVKTREWNSDKLLVGWRAAWAEAQNLALERAGRPERVDSRTLSAQRRDALARGEIAKAAELDREPEIHVGPQARKAGERGARLTSKSRNQATARARGGRWTSARETSRRQRVIEYPRFDRSDRNAYLALLLERRLYRSRLLLAKRERQAARLRDRFLTFEKYRRTGGSRALSPAHVQRRAQQAGALSRQLEQMIRGLFTALTRDTGRRRALVTERDIARALPSWLGRGWPRIS